MRTRNLVQFLSSNQINRFNTVSASPSPSTLNRLFSTTPPIMVARLPTDRCLTPKTMNQAVQDAAYAVRGPIPLRAEEIREEIEEDQANGKKSNRTFSHVLNCNIGNPQQLGQIPITFLRQISALTEYPALIDHPLSASIFPADAIARARTLISEIGSVGAYSHSMGVPAIRKRIADFITERDGYPSHASEIYITAGASAGVANIIQILINSPLDGVLIPIPQYPLYTAALALNSAKAIPYYLNESDDWSLDTEGLIAGVKEAKAEGTILKAMVVINPGNPTGSILSVQNMEDIVKLCYEEKLVLMADEVYQDNIYTTTPFTSFKKVINQMGAPYAKSLELVSFHSISKGQTGECGRRGGYFELVNFSPEAQEQVYKLASIELCPSLGGQIGVDILVCPPKEGEESYPLWKKEKDSIADSLKRRSEIIHKAFQKLEGVTCNSAQGALYLFPTITLPKKAIAQAEKESQSPDSFYSLRLLEATGICVVPGSGFGQVPGTWHFRTTFLAPEVDEYVSHLNSFHTKFMNEFRD